MKKIIFALALSQLVLFVLGGCNLLVAHEEDGSATCASADTSLAVGQQTMNCHKVDSHWEWGPQ